MGQNCLHFVGESNKHRNLLHFGKGVFPFYRIIPLVYSIENVNVNERKLQIVIIFFLQHTEWQKLYLLQCQDSCAMSSDLPVSTQEVSDFLSSCNILQHAVLQLPYCFHQGERNEMANGKAKIIKQAKQSKIIVFSLRCSYLEGSRIQIHHSRL